MGFLQVEPVDLGQALLELKELVLVLLDLLPVKFILSFLLDLALSLLTNFLLLSILDFGLELLILLGQGLVLLHQLLDDFLWILLGCGGHFNIK